MRFDWRKILGITVVLLLSFVLVFMIQANRKKNPYGPVEAVTRAGDWVYNGEGYTVRQLTTVLFIGVGDGEAYGTERDVRYLTLLAVDEDAGTYSILHLDPDTQATVTVTNDRGGRLSEETARLAEAQRYGNGIVTGCTNTVRSVKALLHNTQIDYFVCVKTGGETPTFTTHPNEALATLAQEMADAASYADGIFTNEDGTPYEPYFSTVTTDMNRRVVNDIRRILDTATCETDESFRGVTENGIFYPDRAHAEGVIARLYFKKN